MSIESGAPLRVLIVEDERLIAENLKLIVEDHNYRVVDLASNSEEAIHKAKVSKPDLILMDVRIQGEMDGIHAASLIQQSLAKKPRVLFLSAHSREQFPHIEALDSDSFRYLLKPYTPEDLLAAMDSVLNP
ncbi:response regulator [bacterium]|nr:response regulator [bacterium]MCI0605092.1 response regulator [bacterium]